MIDDFPIKASIYSDFSQYFLVDNSSNPDLSWSIHLYMYMYESYET